MERSTNNPQCSGTIGLGEGKDIQQAKVLRHLSPEGSLLEQMEKEN